MPDPTAGFDASLLDPTTWKEPVEQIPVKVVKSEYRWSDEKYNKATEFRPELPRAIQQWDFQLERLDAKYALLDGTEAPVIIYAGVDLEKLVKNRDGSYELRSVMKGKGKEQLVITGWVKAAGSLVPDPSKLVGQKWMIDFYRQKELGPGFFAKKVALPNRPLDPTFEYTGEVQIFKQTAKDVSPDEAAEAAGGTGAGTPDTADAAAKIGEFIRANGITEFGASTLANPAFPAGCRIEPFVSAIMSGKIGETLAGFGVEI